VRKHTRRGSLAAAGTVLALAAAACGGNAGAGNADGTSLSGTIRIDGSSTVAPLSEAAAELFREDHPDVQITVGTSGTGGGFEKFCNGETDVSDASRHIKDDEKKACAAKGIVFDELQVANDALTIVVNKDNDWIECITTAQLKTIWDQGSTVNNWKQVDPAFPDVPLKLFGAGTDSGTFDYFTDAINGEEGAIRTDYTPSEDDNLTVQGVSGAVGAMGFFGLSYAEQNADAVKLVAVDNGAGCVTPSKETVQDGSYSPLGRPLFIYVNNANYAENPALQGFVNFYLENEEQIAEDALFIDLTDEQAETAKSELATLVGG